MNNSMKKKTETVISKFFRLDDEGKRMFMDKTSLEEMPWWCLECESHPGNKDE